MALFEDATTRLTEAQESAIATYAMCTDEDARRSVVHWIDAWDRALDRGNTLATWRRITEARRVLGPYIYEQGGGI